MKKILISLSLWVVLITGIIGVPKLIHYYKSRPPKLVAEIVQTQPTVTTTPLPTVEPTPVVPTAEPKTRTEIVQYTVASGDTISSIAKHFNITESTILSENKLSATSLIKPGQVLSILPISGITYTVKSGDTLSRIATNNGITVESISAANNNITSANLKIGQTLFLPGATKKMTATPTKTTTTTKSYTSSGVTWTSGALAELNKVPYNLRAAVRTKINNYAKTHGIISITKAVYLSIQI